MMNNDQEFVVMKGNLSEGFEAIGPYSSFDEAASAHEYEECWIMVLNPPTLKNNAEVVDLFNYQETWKNRP